MFEIVYLAARPKLLKQVTDWLWDEWGNRYNYNFFAALVKNCLGEKGLPQLFGAFSDGRLVGTAALIRNDLMSRQDLTPWLSALYVQREERGKGYGTLLQNYAVQAAQQEGFASIYLGSLQIGYYEQNGWMFLEHGILPSGDLIRIYTKVLK